MRIHIVIIFLLLTPSVMLHGGDTRLVTLSTVKARALAMGGAFVSVEDGLAALDFNPATFTLAPVTARGHCAAFLNPTGLLAIRENRGENVGVDVMLGWLFHGVGVAAGRWTFGILWGEESLADKDRVKRNGLFDGRGYHAQRNASMGISLRLAPRVALGLAGEAFIREEDQSSSWTFGYRYGIMLKPKHTLTVGLCFYDFPNAYKNDRMNLERLADETLNIGVCYSPWEFLSLAMDVRNVSDEGKGAVREPHLGFELKPSRRFYFRGGYFRERGGRAHTYSVGVGFKASRWDNSLERFFLNPAFGIHMTFLWEKLQTGVDHWLIISCLLKI